MKQTRELPDREGLWRHNPTCDRWMMMVGHNTGLLYGGWKIGIPEVPLPWTYREELPRGGWSQLPADELAPPIDPPWLRERIKLEVDTAISRQAADELAKVREENKLLIDELQAYAEVSLSAIDARAQTEHELDAAQARIEELERELKASFVRCGEWATKAGEAQGRLEASEMAGTVRRWRERATAAEAERDRLREVLPKLTLKWRIDDFNGKNFPTKREAAYEVEAALKEPTDA
jgi:hypothetical protein